MEVSVHGKTAAANLKLYQMGCFLSLNEAVQQYCSLCSTQVDTESIQHNSHYSYHLYLARARLIISPSISTSICPC